MSKTMKAIVVHDKESSVNREQPIPKLRDDYILVKPVAIALNPTDWKHAAGDLVAPGGILGCDFSGTVEEVGSAVTKSWKKGDKVAGVAHGGNYVQPEDGAFAEYIVAKGDVQMRMPEGMSFEKASTVSLGAITCGQGLFQKALKLNLPTDPVKEKTYVLIYGGSTATGSLAVQFAKLSGYTVLSTCSPKNFEYVKHLGATEVFDYNTPDVGSKIRSYTDNKLEYAWDTISEESSAKICAEALTSSSSAGARYGSILPVKHPRDDVEVTSTLMYTMFGEGFKFATNEIPPIQEDFEWAKMFMGLTEKLLAEGKLETHKERLGKGGLDGALEGMKEMKEGKVSGEKLVYLISETS